MGSNQEVAAAERAKQAMAALRSGQPIGILDLSSGAPASLLGARVFINPADPASTAGPGRIPIYEKGVLIGHREPAVK